MAHFSAFFTAIFLLICALLIEQLAMAQSYGQLLGNDGGGEPDFGEYRSRSSRPRGAGTSSSSSRNGGNGGGGGGLNHDQPEENAGENDDSEENDSSGGETGLSASDGFGDDAENERDTPGDTGERREGLGRREEDWESGADDDEMAEDDSLEAFDYPDALRVTLTDTHRLRPSVLQTGGQVYRRTRGNSRAHGQGYRLPGNRAYNHHHHHQHHQQQQQQQRPLSSPRDGSTKMPTLPEKNEEYDEEGSDDESDEDEDGDSGDSRDTTADSPSNYHRKDQSLLESSSDDYSDDKYSQTDKKAPDTLVT
ncbi:hypothetical protein TYRP_012246 [Tyrophagus putrescentiae]|nr:hypothetical protein TYRP_012246 [Tyrophagus putrescentiae]